MNPTITHPRPEQSTTRATPHAPSRATRRRAAFWLLAFVFAATMLHHPADPAVWLAWAVPGRPGLIVAALAQAGLPCSWPGRW